MAFISSPTGCKWSERFSTATCKRRRSTAAVFCSLEAFQSSPHSLDALLVALRENHKERELKDSTDTASNVGTVYLVGTGPGDPGLLTLRALQLMSRADVVLYDRLVSDSILSFVNSRATMIYVGKEAGFHTRPQDDIHLLLSFFARRNSLVIRLKGGDPFLFGRGGEETDFLEKSGTRVVAIPGITAASGIAAAIGVPLTMRGYATSVRYLTGHVASGPNIDFGPADRLTTYVIYMGLSQFDAIANEMIKNGLDHDTPSVAVERGTTPQQRLVAANLDRLPSLITAAQLKSPTLIIVGLVVSLAPCWDHREQVIESDSAECLKFEEITSTYCESELPRQEIPQ